MKNDFAAFIIYGHLAKSQKHKITPSERKERTAESLCGYEQLWKIQEAMYIIQITVATTFAWLPFCNAKHCFQG
jgi:hypothetical protein